jgi:hypothetical protein
MLYNNVNLANFTTTKHYKQGRSGNGETMDVPTSMKVISPVVGFFENYGYMSESVLKLLIMFETKRDNLPVAAITDEAPCTTKDGGCQQLPQ